MKLRGDSTARPQELLKPIRCSEELDKTVTRYTVQGIVEVRLGYLNGEPFYCVNEPDVNEEAKKELTRFIEALFLEGIDYGEALRRENLSKIARKYKISYDVLVSNLAYLSYFITRGLSGYGALYPLVKDKRIEEIAVNRPGSPALVLHREFGFKWARTNIVLGEDELDDLVVQLARIAGREISIAHPYLEAPLPDGNRIAATFSNEVTRFGSSLVIRKHREEPLTPSWLVEEGVVSPAIMAYLWFLILQRGAVIIAGPTASGKTTLLQSLLMLVPPYSRVVTIEDTPELNLSYHSNWDSLVTRTSYGSGAEDVDMLTLTKFALRRRPDYFVIGEVRGEEAKLLVHAAASGHGALTTFHADSAYSVIRRLMADPISIGKSFLQLIWSIVVIKRVRLSNGLEARRVVEVYEVVPRDADIELLRIAYWQPRSDSHAPGTVDEIVRTSYRLRSVAESSAIGYSLDEIKDTLNAFASFLDAHRRSSLDDFIASLTKLYRELAAKLWV